jgi:general secretion pathway protein E/type IV pilus assembly protein PilB
MRREKIRLGDLLIDEGLISEEQLKEAVKIQKESNFTKKLGEILIDEGFVAGKDLLKVLSKQLGIEFIDIYGEKIDFDALLKYPLKLLRNANAIPFKEDEDYVYVATSAPLNYEALEILENFIHDKPLKLYIALDSDIRQIYKRLEVIQKTRLIAEEVKKELKAEGIKKEGKESAVIRLIQIIVEESINRRASDIHIEPDDNEMIVRIRVDGVLQEVFVFDLDVYTALSSRIKLLGGLDISEKRIPQDGRFSVKVQGRVYDFRLSTTPTLFGESIVMRILDREKVLFKLEDLGFEDKNLEKFNNLIHAPYGIVLVTGPTGSGKTTTLYAALNEIKSIDNKVMTIEDPIEYRLPLVQQVQVNEKIGFDFAVALKSFLRQDPDVILVGEIRDEETLNAAAQASLTGHLVFSTLHTNDAPSAIGRMAQMGLEAYLIADAIVGIVAQRLVRTICPYCKAEAKLPKALFSRIEKYIPKEAKFYIGKGCPKCDFTGYSGRTMISEILVINEQISKLIADNATKFDIYRAAIKSANFQPMIIDGIRKALRGVTTVEEILRVVKDIS